MTTENRQELLLQVDWLGLSLRLSSEVRPIAGYAWKEYSATNVWAKRRVLWTDNGDRVCTLLSEPRSSIIDKNAALLEIENEWLYHGIGVEGILQMLLKSFYYEILGISRLDLAVDFTPTEQQRDIIEALAGNKMYVGRKRNGSTFWSVDTNERLPGHWRGRKIPHQQSWGHKTSSIKWKLYYKTKELWDAGGGVCMHKPYIVDTWRQYGLTENDVWRLEVSLKNLNDYSLYGQHIDIANLAESKVQFYCDLYNDRFTVKLNEGHANKSNDKEVPFLPIPLIHDVIERKEPSKLGERNGRITLLRHLIECLDDEHVLLDEPSRMGVFSHIYDILERDNLGSYFKAITGEWYDEWVTKRDTEARQLFDHRTISSTALRTEEAGKYRGQQLFDIKRGNERMATPENHDYDTIRLRPIPRSPEPPKPDNQTSLDLEE